MLVETGRVVGIAADGLWVETIRHSTCHACTAQQSCGHGLLGRIAGRKRGYIRILPGDRALENCHIDDQVQFTVPEALILRGSCIAYGIPLLAMLSGALTAVRWIPGNEELVAILGAVAGLTLGFALVRWHSAWHRGDARFQPVLTRVIARPAEPVTLL